MSKQSKKPSAMSTDAIIDDWFQANFNHATPGQPLYESLDRARKDLKRRFAENSPQAEE